MNTADHNYETGRYATHIYAYDKAGNMCDRLTNAAVGGKYYSPVASTCYGGHTYELYDIRYWNWTTAKTYCDSIGGYLACITSQGEQEAIGNLITKGSRYGYWFGATDQYVEGNWGWITAEPFSYANWDSGQPDNYGDIEDYGMIFAESKRWNDSPDDVRNSNGDPVYGFICEYSYETNHAPNTCLEVAESSPGQLHIKGWAYDPDDSTQPVPIHIYARDTEQNHYLLGMITADKERTDVNNTFGCGNNHGFEDTLDVYLDGTYDICVAALDLEGSGENTVWMVDENKSFTAVPDFILPLSLTVIEEEAFTGGAFTYVVLPESATTIGSRAFANCTNLWHIFIPESTVSISQDAFEGIPENQLTIHGNIGSYADIYANEKGFMFSAEMDE